MENTKIANRTLDIFRKNFEGKDKTNTKYYFTINVRLDEGDDEIQLVENATGLDNFNNAINDALENDPSEIIIVTTSRKSEPRRKNNTMVVKLQKKNTANTPSTSEMIEKTIAEKMEKIKEGLSGVSGEKGTLGMLTERFGHETKLLQLEMEKKTTQMEHEKMIEDMQRKLDDKDAEILEMRAELKDMDNDMDNLISSFDEYKKNKFAGLSDQLSEVGTKALAGLAAKVLPMLSQGKGVSGLPGDKNTTIIEEDSEVDKLIDNMRDLLTKFSPEQFTKFYNLMILIAADRNTLDIVMKFLKPETDKNDGGTSQ